MPDKRATSPADAATKEKRKAASTHEVIQDLRERIASQALLPGTRVPEEDLAQAYDIPRAKAREVLATLEDRALVERVPNKGAVVAFVDMETTYRLYQVREALDGLAVRLAIANATPADWEAMQALLGEPFEQSLKDGDIEAHVATIEQFRNHIKTLARNPVLSDMIERIYDRTRVSMRRVALLPGRSEMGIKQYRALLDAGCPTVFLGDPQAWKRDAAFDAGLPTPALLYRPGAQAPGAAPAHWKLTAMMDQHAFLKVAEDDGLRVGDIFRIGIVVDDLVHRLDGTLRGALILRHVGNLLRIGKADHVLNISGILGARILPQEPAAGCDRHIVLVGTRGNEGLHDKRLLAPFGKGILLVDRLELARGFRHVAGVHVGKPLLVQNVRRIGLDAELGNVDIRIGLAGRDGDTCTDQQQRNGDPPHRTLHCTRPYMLHSTVPTSRANT